MNENSQTVSVQDIKRKIKQIDDTIEVCTVKIQKAREERGHLEYVLDSFFRKRDFQISYGHANQLTIPNTQGIVEQRKKEVIQILRGCDRDMKSQDIFEALQLRGHTITKFAHDANMSRWSRDPNVPIEKGSYGCYKLSPSLMQGSGHGTSLSITNEANV